MRTITLFTILMTTLSFHSMSQEADCEKFKEGTFYYPSYPQGISVREGNTQKSYTDGELQATWKVKWVSDCSFELTCKKVVGDKVPFQKGDRIHCEIISTKENCMMTRNMLYVKGSKEPSGSEGYICKEVE